MALQRFKELSLWKCNYGGKARASSQNLPGALAQPVSFRERGGTWVPKTGGSLEVNGMDILPCTGLLFFEGVCWPEQLEEGCLGGPQSQLRSRTLGWWGFVLGKWGKFAFSPVLFLPQTLWSIFIQVKITSLAIFRCSLYSPLLCIKAHQSRVVVLEFFSLSYLIKVVVLRIWIAGTSVFSVLKLLVEMEIQIEIQRYERISPRKLLSSLSNTF